MRIRHICILFFLVYTIGSGFAVDSFQPDPYVEAMGTVESPLPLDDFLRLAFIFSGLSVEETKLPMAKVKELSEEILPMLGAVETDRQKGELLLQLLHAKLFKTYVEVQTRLDVLMETGRFNCVSSSILYMYMARRAGLEVLGVATPDHSFCAIAVQGDLVDVEITNPFGFNPGEKKEFLDSFGQVTGYSYVPPGDYSNRWYIRDKELLGFILTNRISSLQRMQKYDEAIPLAVNRYALELNEKGARDLEDALLNWGALLNQKKEYTQALEFIRSAHGYYPQYSRLIPLAGALLYNGVIERLDRQSISMAREFYEQNTKDIPFSAEDVKKTEVLIVEKEAQEILHAADFETALVYVLEQAKKGLLQERRVQEFLVYLYGKRSNDIYLEEGSFAAYSFLSGAPDSVASDRKIIQAKNNYLHNFSVEVHNQFATLMNAGQIEDARRILEEALKLVPQSTMLKKDLQLIENY